MEAPKSLARQPSQARALWLGLKPQRAWLSGGAVLVGITLWVFTGLIGRPKYVTLYSGLKPEDAQSLGSRLAARNIPYQLSPDGGTFWCRPSNSMPAVWKPPRRGCLAMPV